MDKAIIFGVYDFVNFHMCQTLLNQGIEVLGISFEEKEDIPFYEEKRLEVGRNANFIEQSFSNWQMERVEEKSKTVLIFSIYDWYMLHKEAQFLEKKSTKPILDFVEKNAANLELVCMRPIQDLDSNKGSQIAEFMEQVSQKVQRSQVFYLPSIYGPWQPESFLFQQAILSKIREAGITKGDREWTEDTLFVYDAIESIGELFDSGKCGRYVLQSGKKNYWSECAAYLQLDESLTKPSITGSLHFENQVVKVPIQNITPIADSISQQEDHVRRLYQASL